MNIQNKKLIWASSIVGTVVLVVGFGLAFNLLFNKILENHSQPNLHPLAPSVQPDSIAAISIATSTATSTSSASLSISTAAARSNSAKTQIPVTSPKPSPKKETPKEPTPQQEEGALFVRASNGSWYMSMATSTSTQRPNGLSIGPSLSFSENPNVISGSNILQVTTSPNANATFVLINPKGWATGVIAGEEVDRDPSMKVGIEQLPNSVYQHYDSTDNVSIGGPQGMFTLRLRGFQDGYITTAIKYPSTTLTYGPFFIHKGDILTTDFPATFSTSTYPYLLKGL
ncbi:MAG: hypothetical protein PHF79_03030 [Candidatus Pacebacteria bacterium]|nr:hypothetical protein [Candidatus Paceibacterota bacterium]